jgi:hypothetical protein
MPRSAPEVGSDKDLQEVWKAYYEIQMRERMPGPDGFKRYYALERKQINVPAMDIPAEVNSQNQPLEGAAPVNTKANKKFVGPRLPVPGKFTVSISRDGTNWKKHTFTYGMHEMIVPRGNGTSEIVPEYTDKIIIGYNRSDPGALTVTGTFPDKIRFLDIHPQNANSPIWWSEDRQKLAGIYIRPDGVYRNKSCHTFKNEYEAIVAEEKLIFNFSSKRAMQLAFDIVDMVEMKSAVSHFGLSVPNTGIAEKHMFETYQNLLVDYAAAKPGEFIDYIYGGQANMRAMTIKAFNLNIFVYENGSIKLRVKGQDDKVIPWLIIPSDVKPEDLRNYVADKILEKGRVPFVRKVQYAIQDFVAPPVEHKTKVPNYIEPDRDENYEATSSHVKELINKGLITKEARAWVWKVGTDEEKSLKKFFHGHTREQATDYLIKYFVENPKMIKKYTAE